MTRESALYILSGDTPLLINEAADLLIKKAQGNGFEERIRYEITAHFNWEELKFNLQNQSLFAQQQIIDIRNSDNRCDAKANKCLLEIASNISPSQILIVRFGKLTSAQLKSAWYKTLSKQGMSQVLKAPTHFEMPRWIAQRAKAEGINITQDASELLAQLTEGNLLATHQALQKAALSQDDEITTKHVKQFISDSAQYTVFDLSDMLLAGHAGKALHILNHLLGQGLEPTLILWSLAREVRELYNLQFSLSQGKSAAQVFSKVWSSKKPLYQKALKRLPLTVLKEALQQCAQCDKIIKGVSPGRLHDKLSTITQILTRGKSLCQNSLVS
jgi:DNA polymerase III subunit delta